MTREAMLMFMIFRRPKANLNPTIRNKKVGFDIHPEGYPIRTLPSSSASR
jgi:hypothetical protein